MAQYTNEIDAPVDDVIYESIKPSSSKSFFLFAGAGSGKTRTLVNVLARFKKEFGNSYKLRNKRIAIITYTNAAANEIAHRLEYSSIFSVSTIHSFCWELIKSFTSDIKSWIKNNLIIEIAELEEQQSKSRDSNNKTSLSRAKKIQSKNKRLASLTTIQKFIYNPNGDNLTKDSLNHSEVISITVDFIKSKALFQKILITKFPVILIDESQDTKKELIDALFELQIQNEEKFSLGLFGDTMQRIYADGKENLEVGLPDKWVKPTKKMNHRSQSRIVDLINKIRKDIDGQEQLPRNENIGGVVRFFAVSRKQDKFETEKQIRRKMQELTSDGKWFGEDDGVMTLTLEHHMAARRMGFSNFFDPLYAIDKLKTGLLDGTSSSVNLFSRIVLPLYKAYVKKNKFEIANIIKQHSHLIDRQSLQNDPEKLQFLHTTNDKVNELLSLWNEDKHPTLIEILKKVQETNLFKVTSTLKLILQRCGVDSDNNIEDNEIMEDDESLLAWEEALKADFSEIIRYNEYINGESKFGTHQGVKGLEFDRVMVIIDDEESKGFMFSYDKLFGLKPPTNTDKKNLDEGKETGIDRTMRLFYVACSRAKKSLALVCYTDLPEGLKTNIIRSGWFSEDEVEVIA
ncbi:DNA helicase-2/ATP-dependent DNA helicase PcrA [Chitinophaga terrae (ex Kim and Jung 2007)]|uniref:UvrD-helicase domain-containing protein n=1 Tax=Chitinophaga terrae (ex Kim and Jung 2007) TaxID=408074 RepID=UPI00278756F0|nr:UvrD-helicase domain-containing protein [Chitinophaga terrae (ex Kim and Jung 2007)]MDQ0108488.1 DNA helicase-2/ATP-dependent DNA helicase PcrA [Chitinophaga terrae (ex Kim and Jung 2007)]